MTEMFYRLYKNRFQFEKLTPEKRCRMLMKSRNNHYNMMVQARSLWLQLHEKPMPMWSDVIAIESILLYASETINLLIHEIQETMYMPSTNLNPCSKRILIRDVTYPLERKSDCLDQIVRFFIVVITCDNYLLTSEYIPLTGANRKELSFNTVWNLDVTSYPVTTKIRLFCLTLDKNYVEAKTTTKECSFTVEDKKTGKCISKPFMDTSFKLCGESIIVVTEDDIIGDFTDYPHVYAGLANNAYLHIECLED